MANPFAVAVRGKGVWPMLQRGEILIGRYGLTAAKMADELNCLMAPVSAFGGAATLPVTAAPLARHSQLAQDLQARGIELAVHGLRHIDYTQLPFEKQMDELQQALKIFAAAGLQAVGFRSPYLRWNADLLAALRSCGYRYDSSQALAWDVTGGQGTPGYERALEFYGAQRAENHLALPRLQDGLVRIPYCLPDDEALVERLRLQSGRAMAEIWLALLERAYAGGELFTVGLHPERARLCRDALWAVLEKARSLSPGVWIARLDEIDHWQRSLTQATFQTRQEGADGWRISLQGPAQSILLARGVEAAGNAQAWAGRYQQVLNGELSVRCRLRPWIGLAPDCPAALPDFLRQQGYLAEISQQPGQYAFYLQRSAFHLEDERPLLEEIEAGAWPLVRIARWPGGAKAALAVTGDVDAFTIWDYGQRILGG